MGCESQLFIPDYKYVNGNETMFKIYNWDVESQLFIPDYKYEYTYDDNNLITLTIMSIWNNENQSFIPNWERIWTWYYSYFFIETIDINTWDNNLGIYKPRFQCSMNITLDTESELHITGILYLYDTNFIHLG